LEGANECLVLFIDISYTQGDDSVEYESLEFQGIRCNIYVICFAQCATLGPI